MTPSTNPPVDLDADLARRLLAREKCERLEGLCAEHTFRQNLLDSLPFLSSAGWWFNSDRKGEYSASKLVVQPDALSPLDEEILSCLERAGFATRVVTASAAPLTYREHNWVAGVLSDGNELMVSPYAAVKEERVQRRGRAIDWIQARMNLVDTTVERIFANGILPAFSWDIDSIIETARHELVAIDLKHKYPSKSGRFGINKGSAALASALRKAGIKTVNVILNKPERDDRSALEFLDDPAMQSRSAWLAAALTDKLESGTTEDAPVTTALDRARTMSFYGIPLTEYRDLGTLAKPNLGAWESFLRTLP